eukprot:scaffold7836_cov178-Amphora_coffeaeformis.AAC.1
MDGYVVFVLTARVRSGPKTVAIADNRCAAVTRCAMSSARNDSMASRASSSLVMTMGVNKKAADVAPPAEATGVGAAVGGGPSSMGSISMGCSRSFFKIVSIDRMKERVFGIAFVEASQQKTINNYVVAKGLLLCENATNEETQVQTTFLGCPSLSKVLLIK